MDTIRDNASRYVTCRPWTDLEACLAKGYVPTIYPETEQHRRLRRSVLRAGYAVFPPAQVKLTKLTGVQMYLVETYLSCSESSSDRRVVRQAKGATTTRSTATLTTGLALDFIEWLAQGKSDAVDLAGCGNAVTDSQIVFAEWAVARSYDALTSKVKKALRRAQ